MRLPLVAVLLAATLSPIATGLDASEWSLVPAGSALLETSAAVDASNVGLAVRGPAGNHFAISGHAQSATITRFEVKRIIAFQMNGDYTGSPFFDYKEESRQVQNVFFRANSGHVESSVVLLTDFLQFRAPDGRIPISHLENAPVLLGFPDRFLRDEYAAITLNAPAVAVSDTRVEGFGSGELRLYWFNATTEIFHDGGAESLQAFVRAEPIGFQALLVTSTWFDLTAPESRTDVAMQGTDSGWARLFAGALTMKNVSVIAIDRPLEVSGPIVDPKGSSLWLEGFFDTKVSKNHGAESSTFRIHAVGTLRQYSLGGGAANTPDWPIIASSGLLFLAVVAALVLRGLAAGTLIPFYTKLKKDKLLNISSRDAIYRVIQQTPGIHFLELQKQVGSTGDQGSPIGFGALAYHLGQMERFELIVSKREGRFRRYFDVSAKLGADASRVALLQTSPVNLVARVVLESPGANQGDLHSRVGHHYQMTRQALSYHLRRLADKELVEIEMRGRFCHYRATERLQKLSSFIVDSQVVPGSDVVAAV